MEKLAKEQKEIIEKFQKNFDKLTYAQREILERTLQKTTNVEFQDCYGTDYNDCHGDYYDADY